MDLTTRLVLPTAIVVLCSVSSTVLAGDRPRNLIPNGGFEQGTKGWSWAKKGEGRLGPGFLDRETPFEGLLSYAMTLPGAEGGRSLMITADNIDPTKNYELRLALRGTDLPEESVRVRLLQWGTAKSGKADPLGWIWRPGQRGVYQLIVTGGTFDWTVHRVHIHGKDQNLMSSTKRLTLYIECTGIGQGQLGVDRAWLAPVMESGRPATG